MGDATFWQFTCLWLYVLGAVHSRTMTKAIAVRHFPQMRYREITVVIYGILWPIMAVYTLAERD